MNKGTNMRITKLRGFTLIEVLVALLVLSIGLLGLAALQTVSLQFNTGSYASTQATLVAYEIIERMRSNPTATKAGAYDVLNPSAAATAAGDTTDCQSASCNSSDIAKYDLARWYSRMKKLLPDSDITGNIALIQRDTVPTSPTFNSVTITIKWRENDTTKKQEWKVQL